MRFPCRFDHSQLFVDGKPVELPEFISWPRLSREIVRFHADKLPNIHRYHSFIMSEDGQKAEFKYEPSLPHKVLMN